MAQIIQHKRGVLEDLSGVTANKGELLVVTGSSISALADGLVFVGNHSDLTSVNKILTGSSSPNMASYDVGVNGLPFYNTSDKKLQILRQDGNLDIILAKNQLDLDGTGIVSSSAQVSALAGINNSTLTVTAGTNLGGGGTFTTNQAGNSAVTLNLDTDGTGFVSGSTQIISLVGIDEDNFASNSATKLPTQQSVKAYVDSKAAAQDNTDELTEGSTNLFFTNDRVRDYVRSIDVISGSNSITIDGSAIALGGSVTTLQLGTTNSTALAGNTTTISTAQGNKLGFISVTQAVDLDTIESNTSTNNDKVGYTDALVKTKLNAETVISGSSQVDATSVANFDTNVRDYVRSIDVISGSSQVNADSIANFDTNVQSFIRATDVISGSSQIDVTATTNYSSINQYTDSDTTALLRSSDVISGSSQVDVTATTNYSGISQYTNTKVRDYIRSIDVVSGSSQLLSDLDGRYLEINGYSVVSQSAQIDYNSIQNQPTIPSAASNATITLTAGTDLGTGGNFTTNQSSNETITINHSNVSRSDTTSTGAPSYGGTFTAVDSVTTSARGHVTALNVKTITIPSSDDTAYNLNVQAGASNTSIIRLAGSDSTNDDVTLSGGTGITISESGNVITITGTAQYGDSDVQDFIRSIDVISGSAGILAAVSVDEDNFSSNSATKLPTQQSVKAYVDSKAQAQDNTDELTEGSTNLFFTNARVDSRMNSEDVVSGSATQVRSFLNVENGADVTDTANVTSAGALMDSEITNLAAVKAFDGSDYLASSVTTISSGQASAITANTAKTGITSGQTSAISANTAKVTANSSNVVSALSNQATDFGSGRVSGDNFGDVAGTSTMTGSFVGDGSALTGVASSLTVNTQDVNLKVDDLDIVGTANEIEISTAKSGNDVTVTVGIPTNPTLTGNVTVTGDLTVEGTTTTIDSVNVNIGDRILELNYAGDAGNAGLLVSDVDGSSTVSGSLLWNGANGADYWMAGKLGSEKEIATLNAAPTSNRVLKANASGLLVDSTITDDGTDVSITGDLTVTGLTAGANGAFLYADADEKLQAVNAATAGDVIQWNGSSFVASNAIDGGTF